MARASGETDPQLAKAKECRANLGRAAHEIDGLINSLERGVKSPVKVASNAVDSKAEHRRKHRSGVPSKLASDPELRAFVIARLDTKTFKQSLAAIADHFPPERRITLSTLSRWWIANRDLMAAHKV